MTVRMAFLTSRRQVFGEFPRNGFGGIESGEVAGRHAVKLAGTALSPKNGGHLLKANR